jgi:hypothetical protein
VTDELGEIWGAEYGLVKEVNFQVVEQRGRIDPGQDVLQIFASAFEIKICESREDRAHGRGRMLASLVRTRSRRLEFKVE